MHKILIVDDIKTNRQALSLILSELEDIEFFEAENGKEGVALAKQEKPEIIFMDIMMPLMDGVEATKQIKSLPECKNTFIFAITALDDDKTKDRILEAGAGDFVNKPFDDEELLLRTRNYLDLLEKRHKPTPNPTRTKVALYDDAMMSNIRTVIHVQGSNDLLDLLDFIDDHHLYQKSFFNDVMTLIITVSTVLFKARKLLPFDVIIEHSSTHAYVSIWNETFAKVAGKYFDRFSSGSIESKCDNGKVTFRITTSHEYHEPSKPEPAAPTSELKPAIKEVKNEEEVVEDDALYEDYSKAKAEVVVQDFISEEDLEDLTDFVKELNSMLMVFGRHELEPEDITDIQQALSKIAQVLQFYPETYNIAMALKKLSDEMSENIQGFIENSSSIAELFQAFGNDLQVWLDTLFVKGTDDVHFLDDTLISNAELIANFAKTEAGAESDDALDDIFDF